MDMLKKVFGVATDERPTLLGTKPTFQLEPMRVVAELCDMQGGRTLVVLVIIIIVMPLIMI